MDRIEKRPRWTRLLVIPLLGCLPTLMLSGCDKLGQRVAEKITEKLLEVQNGGQAKVDMSDGKTKVTLTDAQGQITHMEMEGAQVDASDFGLPPYPGAKALDAESQRVQTPEQRMVTAVFESRDSSEKIATFYREVVRDLAGGRILMDNTNDERAMLVLADASERSIILRIESGGRNTQRIQMISTTPLKK